MFAFPFQSILIAPAPILRVFWFGDWKRQKLREALLNIRRAVNTGEGQVVLKEAEQKPLVTEVYGL